MTLTLLSYNIQRGGIGRERQIAAVINEQRPDLVVFQEATRPDVVRRLADATEMPTAIAMRGRSVGVISRVPLRHYRYARPLFSQHAFLEVSPEGTSTRIVGVHLSAVHAAWTEQRRVRELRSLLRTLKTYEQDVFHVVMGDFNTLAPDEGFNFNRLPLRLRMLVWLSGGRIRWQTIAIMLGAEYADAYRLLNATDHGYTFPTWDPHVRLDYAFVPKAFAERLASCEVVTAGPVRLASDHLPLKVTLRLDPPHSND